MFSRDPKAGVNCSVTLRLFASQARTSGSAGAGVVHHDVQRHARVGPGDLAQEFEKFLVLVAGVPLPAMGRVNHERPASGSLGLAALV
jgi:hypothetical protein